MFLSRISMSAKQEESRIEHHFIDIKKVFPMHPDSGFQHFVVFLPSNSGEDQVRPGETHKHPGTLWMRHAPSLALKRRTVRVPENGRTPPYRSSFNKQTPAHPHKEILCTAPDYTSTTASTPLAQKMWKPSSQDSRHGDKHTCGK